MSAKDTAEKDKVEVEAVAVNLLRKNVDLTTRLEETDAKLEGERWN